MDVAVLIVNSLASLTAIIGLIITCSQFGKTMKAQNRATNVSLFDLRMEILACVENEKLTFNRTKAQLLFNNDIAEKIKQYDSTMKEFNRYRALRCEFIEFIQSLRVNDTYEEATDLLEAIRQYDSADPDDPVYQQLKESLRRRSYTGKWTNGVDPLRIETVNYVDVQEQEALFHSQSKSVRKEITVAMKQFIETSIQ